VAGSGFLGLTPPGQELAPRSGLEKARQRKSVTLASLSDFSTTRSIGVETANDAGEVACNKPEAQAKGVL
jgi:hypothetical protein